MSPDSSANRYAMTIAAIMLLGAALRLVAWMNTCIITNDAVLYIQQARVLFYGGADPVADTGMSYLSLHSVFVAAAYFFIRDWVVSGHAVSWFFGSATLIPVFLIFRRFFDRQVTGLGLLVFAVTPVFVYIGSEVLREPVAYFFAAWGFHFVLRHLEDGGSIRNLALSLLCLLAASLTRVEILSVFAVTCLFSVFFSPRRLAAIGFLALCLAALFSALVISNAVIGLGVEELFRSRRALSWFSDLWSQYESMRSHLRTLALSHEYAGTPVGWFMAEARNLLWFLAGGALLRTLVNTLFYPLAIFFVAGIPRSWKMIGQDRRILYLTAAAATVFAVFYLHQAAYWIAYSRLMALGILPAMFVTCCGLAASRDFLARRLKVSTAVVAVLLGAAIFSVTLPKNISERECDKVVLIEIGEAVAAHDGGAGPFMITASGANQRWVPFYANREYPGVLPSRIFRNSWINFPKDMERFIIEMRERNIDYLLWDERNWGPDRFPIEELLGLPGVEVVGTYEHADTGEMILIRIPEKDA